MRQTGLPGNRGHGPQARHANAPQTRQSGGCEGRQQKVKDATRTETHGASGRASTPADAGWGAQAPRLADGVRLSARRYKAGGTVGRTTAAANAG
ncbi:MAG: hypothetical protein WC696_10590 [Candidatus Methylopumilus sp.]